MLKLHNSLTRQIEPFASLIEGQAAVYSCGPTVYDHVHIGNLSAFIAADTLRRVLAANNLTVKHAMNFTDVDDKTIRRSAETYPDIDAMEALRKLTSEYSQLFINDMKAVGNDVEALTFIKATADETIDGMRQLISELHRNGFAYIADDGVYFSIDAYKKSGKKYGQLVEITESNTSSERIQNDEYDKDSVHDFALWKVKKPGEPAWDFTLDDHELSGRPGWHIECSVMSHLTLGQPFDIHTGGVDLAFPHHENEIAQSTAGRDNPTYATIFVHNEHILVDGKKMSKSLDNFYTLGDLQKRNIDPLAFRLLVLQSHYRRPTSFSFENAEAARNRLQHWRSIAALRHQVHDGLEANADKREYSNVKLLAVPNLLIEALNDDIDTPRALAIIDDCFSRIDEADSQSLHQGDLTKLIECIDQLLGVGLINATPDINDDQKRRLLERRQARDSGNWEMSDKIRDEFNQQGIQLKDTPHGTIWSYV